MTGQDSYATARGQGQKRDRTGQLCDRKGAKAGQKTPTHAFMTIEAFKPLCQKASALQGRRRLQRHGSQLAALAGRLELLEWCAHGQDRRTW